MKWPGESGRAEQFARLLDGSTADVPADPELARLAVIAGQLRAIEPAAPHAEFRALLRAHLVSLAGPAPVPRTDPAGQPGPAGAAGTTRVDPGDLAAAPGDVPGDHPGDVATDDLATDDLATDDLATDDLATDDLATDDLERDDLAGRGPENDGLVPGDLVLGPPEDGGLADGGLADGGPEDGPGELDEDGQPPQRRLRLVPPVQRSSRWRRPRVGLVAASLVLLLLAGMAVLGSRNALPGDPLYALKRGTENAELLLARGDEARGRRYLDLARTRAGEVRDLATDRDADPTTLVDTFGALDQQTKAGVRLLTMTAVGQKSEDPLVFVLNWTNDQYKLLAALPSLPATVQPRLLSSATVLLQVAQRARTLSTQLGCACLAGAPTDELGTYPCKGPCAGAQKPASSTPTTVPTRPGTPKPTGAPRPTGQPSGSAPPRPTSGPGQGGGNPATPGPTGSGSSTGGGGGLPLPLPLPTGGGNLPLPSIPGLPLPTSLPLPLPLPTSGLPLPTGLLPSLLPSLLPGAGG